MGTIYPYYALYLGRWAFLLIFILLSLNLLNANLNLRSILRYNLKDLYYIFFSFFFIPSLVFSVASILGVNHTIKFGFFITSLAPFAIAAPPLLASLEDRHESARLVLISSLLFPVYFPLMIYLFFPNFIKTNTSSIAYDSFVLTFIPLVIVIALRYFFPKLTQAVSSSIKKKMQLINIIMIGFLSFIFLGNSLLKNDLDHFSLQEWFIVFMFGFFQDFGVYGIAKIFGFHKFFRLTVSFKNVAFVGIFMNMFFPNALISVVAVFLMHIPLIFYHMIKFSKDAHSTNESLKA